MDIFKSDSLKVIFAAIKKLFYVPQNPFKLTVSSDEISSSYPTKPMASRNTDPRTNESRNKSLGTGHKLEDGGGWCKHGEGHCFSGKHKREGQTIWCMSLRGAIIFYAKLLGSRSQSSISL